MSTLIFRELSPHPTATAGPALVNISSVAVSHFRALIGPFSPEHRYLLTLYGGGAVTNTNPASSSEPGVRGSTPQKDSAVL